MSNQNESDQNDKNTEKAEIVDQDSNLDNATGGVNFKLSRELNYLPKTESHFELMRQQRAEVAGDVGAAEVAGAVMGEQAAKKGISNGAAVALGIATGAIGFGAGYGIGKASNHDENHSKETGQ